MALARHHHRGGGTKLLALCQRGKSARVSRACGARRKAVARPEVLDAVVRHGLVDEVSRRSKRLFAALGRRNGLPNIFLADMAQDYPGSAAARLSDTQRSRISLAAIALMAAARRTPEPFADATVRKLSRATGDDPLIPATAIWVWTEITAGVDVYDKWVEFPGLPAIWRKVAAQADLPYEPVNRLAYITVFQHALRPELEPVFRGFARRSDLTPSQKADLAGQLALYYYLVDEPERLMREGGSHADADQVQGARTLIGMARLRAGYDAAGARAVQAHIFDELATPGLPMRLSPGFDDTRLDPLERAGAKRELREIADEFVRRAREYCCEADVSMLFANASDCYRRAGDRERAIEVAREGLKHARPMTSLAWPEPRSPYLAAALYRAGNIEEALATKLLSDRLRFQNAGRAGEPRDARWLANDEDSDYAILLVREAVNSPDATFRRSASEALKDRCANSQDPGCRVQTAGLRAELAASLGDAAQVSEILGASVHSLGTTPGAASDAVELAAWWAHALELLRAPRR